MPENRDAVALFYALRTQWNLVACMSGFYWQGLDYARVRAYLDISGIDRARWREIMLDLQLMEITALPLLNARYAKNR